MTFVSGIDWFDSKVLTTSIHYHYSTYYSTWYNIFNYHQCGQDETTPYYGNRRQIKKDGTSRCRYMKVVCKVTNPMLFGLAIG